MVAGLGNPALPVVSEVFGWIYFFAWSFSFYPQCYENWKRKSVVGFSLDFLCLNITGFVCYATYNVCLYFGQSFQLEYLAANSAVSIPVKVNDVVFSLHAVAICSFQIFQCCIYDRGTQKVALPVILLTVAMWISIVIVLLLVSALGQQVVTWLFFINFLSWLKAGITFIKYMPQAWLNFKRKSTVGWSIGNVLLDLTGGLFSFGQLFVDAVYVGNWSGFSGDVAKTLLAVFSILFDGIFITQHYICYPVRKRRDPRLLYIASEGEKYISDEYLIK